MTIPEFLQTEIFRFGDLIVTVGDAVSGGLTLFAILAAGYWLIVRVLPRFFKRSRIDAADRRRITLSALMALFFLITLAVMRSSGINPELWRVGERVLRLSLVAEVLFILQLARLLDTIIELVLARKYSRRHREDGLAPARNASVARPLLYTLAVLLLIQQLGLNYTLFTFKSGGNVVDFKLSKIIVAVAVVFGARLFYWVLTQLALYTYYRRHRINEGSRYAANRLLAYFIYTVAGLMAIEMLGVRLTVIWGGAAALLVGIGLGLQQTFNDLICGIILLFERTVEVGDVVEMDGMVGSVKQIGLRTSLVETRDNVTVIVPNSMLITDKVINWSHFDDKARYKLQVGVAYNSDPQLVKQLLLEAVSNHDTVLANPAPIVRLVNFGESSLDFEALFWTKDLLEIENIRSDIRFEIERLFRENNIVIPYPQRDVWVKEMPPIPPYDK
ncbi:MAG: mechanosensitive ion channel [Saprospiraceae bacterium]|nr:mechanosensitive ion channel [Saprospiraceae bacterium]